MDGLRLVRRRVSGVPPEWEYLPDGWATKEDKIEGWHDSSIAETQKAKWEEFLRITRGTGPLGISFEAPSLEREDYYAHHVLMAYGYVLALAARKKDRISILDWGGGIGHYYIFSRALLPELYIDYCCKDHPLVCEAGRKVLPDARFVERERDVVDQRYDLVLASGVLPYSEDWRWVARLLVSVSAPYLYVTRSPFVHHRESFVAVQRAYAYGYDTEFMGWVINREEFLAYMTSLDVDLVREFVLDEHPAIRHIDERVDIRGFLFRRKSL
jgi:putative methyltransferase (TIGR04325 family)